MKQGYKQEMDLMQEVARQAETKRDYIVPTNLIKIEPKGDNVEMIVNDEMRLGINDVAHRQIGEHAKIPALYYDRMLHGDDADRRLLGNNIEHWFRRFPTRQMVRTLDNTDRAFLSDKFRALDNVDLVEAIVPQLHDRGVKMVAGQVTQKKLYMQFVDGRIERDLKAGTALGRGHDRFETCSPALTVSNSEVGLGALSINTSVWFGGCTNLVVLTEKSVRKYHVGARHDIGEEIYAMLSDTTKKLTNAALWATVRDVVGNAFDQAAFDATVAQLQDAKNDVVEADPVKVIEVVGKRLGFGENERGSILRRYCETGDFSRFGVQAAITRAAQDVQDYDRAMEFEQIGGKVIELPKSEWKAITKAFADEKVAEAA